ncbi:MerR family transcriptional regulator [Tomitella gaofuii]|uniref:MerR family transcriptional regulator n=1 Tax=Tomitella gaofuii TaxID=2760083 RepID=UPI002E2BCB27|nr:MerR family transcriptional regulator [Tomitella gaofuii]
MDGRMQIGEVAERTGLSLRTIRYYEEVGLAVPSSRSQGGFRLYSAEDLDRLLLLKSMKPAGLQLAEIRELLTILDRPAAARTDDDRSRLAEFAAQADAQREKLRRRIDTVTGLVETLTAEAGA